MGYWGSTKPPFGTPIDPSHPLAQGLVALFPCNEGAGIAIADVANAGRFAMAKSTTTNMWSPWPYLNLGTSSDFFKTQTPGYLKIQPPLSLVWQGVVPSAPANGQVSFGVFYNDGNSAPFVAYLLNFSQISPGQPSFQWNVSGTQKIVHAPATTPVGTRFQQAGLVSPNTFHVYGAGAGDFNAAILIDGRRSVNNPAEVFTGTAAPINYASSAPLSQTQIGAGPLLTELAGVWSRVLSQSELQWLKAEPFDMFAPPRRASRTFLLSSPPSSPLFRRTLFDRAGSRGVG